MNDIQKDLEMHDEYAHIDLPYFKGLKDALIPYF